MLFLDLASDSATLKQLQATITHLRKQQLHFRPLRDAVCQDLLDVIFWGTSASLTVKLVNKGQNLHVGISYVGADGDEVCQLTLAKFLREHAAVLYHRSRNPQGLSQASPTEAPEGALPAAPPAVPEEAVDDDAAETVLVTDAERRIREELMPSVDAAQKSMKMAPAAEDLLVTLEPFDYLRIPQQQSMTSALAGFNGAGKTTSLDSEVDGTWRRQHCVRDFVSDVSITLKAELDAVAIVEGKSTGLVSTQRSAELDRVRKAVGYGSTDPPSCWRKPLKDATGTASKADTVRMSERLRNYVEECTALASAPRKSRILPIGATISSTTRGLRDYRNQPDYEPCTIMDVCLPEDALRSEAMSYLDELRSYSKCLEEGNDDFTPERLGQLLYKKHMYNSVTGGFVVSNLKEIDTLYDSLVEEDLAKLETMPQNAEEVELGLMAQDAALHRFSFLVGSGDDSVDAPLMMKVLQARDGIEASSEDIRWSTLLETTIAYLPAKSLDGKHVIDSPGLGSSHLQDIRAQKALDPKAGGRIRVDLYQAMYEKGHSDAVPLFEYLKQHNILSSALEGGEDSCVLVFQRCAEKHEMTLADCKSSLRKGEDGISSRRKHFSTEHMSLLKRLATEAFGRLAFRQSEIDYQQLDNIVCLDTCPTYYSALIQNPDLWTSVASELNLPPLELLQSTDMPYLLGLKEFIRSQKTNRELLGTERDLEACLAALDSLLARYLDSAEDTTLDHVSANFAASSSALAVAPGAPGNQAAASTTTAPAGQQAKTPPQALVAILFDENNDTDEDQADGFEDGRPSVLLHSDDVTMQCQQFLQKAIDGNGNFSIENKHTVLQAAMFGKKVVQQVIPGAAEQQEGVVLLSLDSCFSREDDFQERHKMFLVNGMLGHLRSRIASAREDMKQVLMAGGFIPRSVTNSEGASDTLKPKMVFKLLVCEWVDKFCAMAFRQPETNLLKSLQGVRSVLSSKKPYRCALSDVGIQWNMSADWSINQVHEGMKDLVADVVQLARKKWSTSLCTALEKVWRQAESDIDNCVSKACQGFRPWVKNVFALRTDEYTAVRDILTQLRHVTKRAHEAVEAARKQLPSNTLPYNPPSSERLLELVKDTALSSDQRNSAYWDVVSPCRAQLLEYAKPSLAELIQASKAKLCIPSDLPELQPASEISAPPAVSCVLSINPLSDRFFEAPYAIWDRQVNSLQEVVGRLQPGHHQSEQDVLYQLGLERRDDLTGRDLATVLMHTAYLEDGATPPAALLTSCHNMMQTFQKLSEMGDVGAIDTSDVLLAQAWCRSVQRNILLVTSAAPEDRCILLEGASSSVDVCYVIVVAKQKSDASTSSATPAAHLEFFATRKLAAEGKRPAEEEPAMASSKRLKRTGEASEGAPTPDALSQHVHQPTHAPSPPAPERSGTMASARAAESPGRQWEYKPHVWSLEHWKINMSTPKPQRPTPEPFWFIPGKDGPVFANEYDQVRKDVPAFSEQVSFRLGRFDKPPYDDPKQAGDDAHHIQSNLNAMSDGVGGAPQPRQSAMMANDFVKACGRRIMDLGSVDVSHRGPDYNLAFEVFEAAHADVKRMNHPNSGATTATVAALVGRPVEQRSGGVKRSSSLHVAWMGDTQLAVLRPLSPSKELSCVYLTPSTYMPDTERNPLPTPGQMSFQPDETLEKLRDSKVLCVHEVPLEDGDFVLLGSDGLWDNLPWSACADKYPRDFRDVPSDNNMKLLIEHICNTKLAANRRTVENVAGVLYETARDFMHRHDRRRHNRFPHPFNVDPKPDDLTLCAGRVSTARNSPPAVPHPGGIDPADIRAATGPSTSGNPSRDYVDTLVVHRCTPLVNRGVWSSTTQSLRRYSEGTKEIKVFKHV
mmetsp:Transcript_22623/g.62787  ORF Transcript_22623/g.62787 Transcript_22623/m.62787 type:complete len:1858 (-) Transcript_22623:116-5689(-)